MEPLLRQAKRLVVLVLGLSVLLVGIAMMVLPGPAFLVIPAGLAILATEFIWAQRLLKQMKHQAQSISQAMGYGKAAQEAAAADAAESDADESEAQVSDPAASPCEPSDDDTASAADAYASAAAKNDRRDPP